MPAGKERAAEVAAAVADVREIEKRAGLRISRSRLSVVLREKGLSAGGDPATR